MLRLNEYTYTYSINTWVLNGPPTRAFGSVAYEVQNAPLAVLRFTLTTTHAHDTA